MIYFVFDGFSDIYQKASQFEDFKEKIRLTALKARWTGWFCVWFPEQQSAYFQGSSILQLWKTDKRNISKQRFGFPSLLTDFHHIYLSHRLGRTTNFWWSESKSWILLHFNSAAFQQYTDYGFGVPRRIKFLYINDYYFGHHFIHYAFQ